MAGHDVIGPFSTKSEVDSLAPCSRISRLWSRHASASRLHTLQAAIFVAKCSGAPEIADVCGVLTPAAVLTLYPQLDRWQTWQTFLIGTVEVAVQGTQGTQDQSSPAHQTEVLRDSLGFHGIPWLLGFKLNICQCRVNACQ